MVQLSPAAADVVRRARDEGGNEDRLLRFAPDSQVDGDRLRLSFVASARPGDQVAEEHGVRVCVASDVAESLTHAVLDVKDTQGRPKLVLRGERQAPE